jgi:hypothetical protein
MREPIQLGIPSPCGEDWDRMQPAEKGRHCERCCKTVVDFTEMSDEAIIRYVTERPGNICGRLMPDQLGRKLAPAPVQRNGWSGWRWLIAGLVMVGKGAESRRPVKPQVEARVQREVDPRIGYSVPVVGDTVMVTRPESAVDGELVIMPHRVKDSARLVKGSGAQMGSPVLERIDSVTDPADEIPKPAPLLIHPPLQRELVGYAGGISVGQCVKIRTIDTVTDILKQAVVDTLTALTILPKNELTVYPNPVARGGALQMAWQAEPGKYQLTLLNIGGGLVQQRILEVAGKGQVDQWEVPVGLAAGIYVLRVVKEEGVNSYTREIVVR